MATFSVNDMFMGTMDDDVLWGGVGDDTLQGGAGDDRLIGGPGADSLDGGPGSDTADYAMSDAGVHVDLSSSFGGDDDDPGPVRGGHAEGDTLQSIENIWGSSYSDKLVGNHVANMLFGRGGNDEIMGGRGNDSIWGHTGADELMGGLGHDKVFGGSDDDYLMGDAGNDILMGQAGDDVLDGGNGNDILEGGMGADELDGGDGMDTAAYTMSEEGVTINLGNVGTARPVATGGDAMGDTLMDIENVRGSMDDDMLTGDGEDNKLYGNQGDDELMGGGGDDMLRGGMGDDELDGGAGDDTIYGDKGDDTLTGNGGDDTFVLREGDGDDVIEDFDESGNDKIQLGTSKLTSSQVSRVLRSEEENRDGTYTYEWEDTTFTVGKRLTADDLGAQADRPVQLTGDGASWPGADDDNSGDDEVDGSRGDDTIYGGRGDDTLLGSAGDDMLSGGRDDDMLEGGRGDDTLMGGDGRDDLRGDAGDDLLDGGRGNDMLSGGGGKDTFRFWANGNSDTITDFHDGDVIALGSGPASDATIAYVLNSEERVDDGFRYKYGDTFITVNQQLTEADFEKPSTPKPSVHNLDDQNNQWGEPGGEDNSRDDLVMGNGGDDTLHGGAGDDTLKGGDDEDTLNGDAGNDKLYGDDGEDMLNGGAGNDMLMGGDDDDMLDGGAGNDTLTGGDGSDTFKFGARANSDTITDFEDGDMIALGSAPMSMSKTDIDQVLKSMDDLGGGQYNYAWRGTDFTVNRKLTAGDFMMEAEPVGKTTDLQDDDDKWGNATDMDATDYNGLADMVDGDGGVDTLMGGDGDDTLRGGDDDDDLQGEDGNDKLYGDGDDDTLRGGDGNDTLNGGSGNDMLMGGDGDDELNGGSGNDTLMGGAGDDELTGGSGVDKLEGGGGSDTLNAGHEDIAPDILARGATRASADAPFDVTAFDVTMDGTLLGGEDTDDMDMDTLSFEDSEMGVRVLTATDDPGTTDTDETETSQYEVHSSFEKVIGSSNADKLTLGAAGELMGGDGDDTLSARASGTSPVVHYAANLMGGDGNDTLTGGGGNDTLDGGDGTDSLTGGAGEDTFVWGNGDTIEDFDVADDKPIQLEDGVKRVTFHVHDLDGDNTIDVLRATLHGEAPWNGQTMDFDADATRGIPLTVPTDDTAYSNLINELFTGGDGDLFNLG